MHGDENIRLGSLKSLLATNHSDLPALIQISFEASGGSGGFAGSGGAVSGTHCRPCRVLLHRVWLARAPAVAREGRELLLLLRRLRDGEEGKARRGGECATRREKSGEVEKARRGGESGEEGRSRRGRESAARGDVNVMRMDYSHDVFALLHQGQETFVFWLHCCDSRAKIYANIRHKTWKK